MIRITVALLLIFVLESLGRIGFSAGNIENTI